MCVFFPFLIDFAATQRLPRRNIKYILEALIAIYVDITKDMGYTTLKHEWVIILFTRKSLEFLITINYWGDLIMSRLCLYSLYSKLKDIEIYTEESFLSIFAI